MMGFFNRTPATEGPLSSALTATENDHKPTATTTEKATTNSNCCSCTAMRAAISHPAFSQTETTGQQIHGPQTFGPASTASLALKSLLMGWAVSLGVMEFLGRENQTFFLAYLNNVTLVVSTLYLIASWFHSLYGAMRPSVHETPTITALHKVTWALYAIAGPGEVVVTVGYWGMDWNGNWESALDYYNLSVHSGILLALLLEGLIINRIPLRLRHMGLLLAYMAGYLIWTVVHALLGMGDLDSEDDDNIYAVLRWNQAPWTTAGYAALFLFVLTPASFVTVYWMSLPWRRYSQVSSNMDDSHSESITSYVELNRMRAGAMV